MRPPKIFAALSSTGWVLLPCLSKNYTCCGTAQPRGGFFRWGPREPIISCSIIKRSEFQRKHDLMYCSIPIKVQVYTSQNRVKYCKYYQGSTSTACATETDNTWVWAAHTSTVRTNSSHTLENEDVGVHTQEQSNIINDWIQDPQHGPVDGKTGKMKYNCFSIISFQSSQTESQDASARKEYDDIVLSSNTALR